MELYKLITIVIAINLGMSLGYTASQGGTLTTWITSVQATNANNGGQAFANTIGDSSNAVTQQNTAKIDDLGGISAFWLIVNGIYTFVVTVLIGGLKICLGALLTVGQIAYTLSQSGNEYAIFNIITYAAGIVISALYGFTGLKIYSWIRNRDIR